MTQFQLVTVEGVALGPVDFGARRFLRDDVIQWFRGNLRVLDVVEVEEPERFTILVIEPID